MPCPICRPSNKHCQLSLLPVQGREKFSEFAARHTKQLLSWEQSERLADIVDGRYTPSLCI